MHSDIIGSTPTFPGVGVGVKRLRGQNTGVLKMLAVLAAALALNALKHVSCEFDQFKGRYSSLQAVR